MRQDSSDLWLPFLSSLSVLAKTPSRNLCYSDRNIGYSGVIQPAYKYLIDIILSCACNSRTWRLGQSVNPNAIRPSKCFFKNFRNIFLKIFKIFCFQKFSKYFFFFLIFKIIRTLIFIFMCNF